MMYNPVMVCETQGIIALSPANSRFLNGLLPVYWEAEGQRGAKGYYKSSDPRVIVFLNDVADSISKSNDNIDNGSQRTPMARAMYIPAGVETWTKFTSLQRCAHLDVNIHEDRLMKLLSPAIGRSAAANAVRSQIDLSELEVIQQISSIAVQEMTNETKAPIFLDTLCCSIVAAVLDPKNVSDSHQGASLSRAQMKKLNDFVDGSENYRMSVAEMAALLGKTESWFFAAFRKTNSRSPLNWLLEKRIEAARQLLLQTDLPLAAIAGELGFTDQSHFTKAFRGVCGQPPAAWRRANR